YMVNSGYASIGDQKGINGLPYVSAQDPRVPTFNAGPLYSYPNITAYGFTPWQAGQYVIPVPASITIASGVEARLIEAEALLRAGDAAGSLAKLNDLRA